MLYTHGHKYLRIELGDFAFMTSISPNLAGVITAVETQSDQWAHGNETLRRLRSIYPFRTFLCPCV
jgi:hypothetical protein